MRTPPHPVPLALLSSPSLSYVQDRPRHTCRRRLRAISGTVSCARRRLGRSPPCGRRLALPSRRSPPSHVPTPSPMPAMTQHRVKMRERQGRRWPSVVVFKGQRCRRDRQPSCGTAAPRHRLIRLIHGVVHWCQGEGRGPARAVFILMERGAIQSSGENRPTPPGSGPQAPPRRRVHAPLRCILLQQFFLSPPTSKLAAVSRASPACDHECWQLD